MEERAAFELELVDDQQCQSELDQDQRYSAKTPNLDCPTQSRDFWSVRRSGQPWGRRSGNSVCFLGAVIVP
jgi:hypothetical protein